MFHPTLSEGQAIGAIEDRAALVREFYNAERDYLADLALLLEARRFINYTD